MMKNILKFIFFCAISLSVGASAFSQAVDMAVDNPNMSRSPTSFPGTTTISFDFQGEQGSHVISSDDLASNFMVINITLSKLDGSGIQPTGAGAALFNWTYIAATGVLQGTSRDATVVEDVIYPIIFTDLPTTSASTANDVGFKVNLVPPGDLLNSVTTDDKLELFTSAPLPVKLISFDAAREGSIASLNWATTEETNSDRFDIERSTNGKAWALIGTVASNGESVTRRDYRFADQAPAAGPNYYRLKMVDKDDTYAYSRLRVLDFDGSPSVSVYPNPVSEVLFVKDAGLGTIKSVSIVNMNGHTVYQAGTVAAEGINVKGLANGMYIVKITGAGGALYTHKVVISK